MTAVVWSAHARSQLRAILRYVHARSPQGAARLAGGFLRQAARLARFPLSGRRVPEFAGSEPVLREFIVEEHRLVYALRGGRAEILSVFHGRRQFPALEPPLQ